jgi:GxxExxY protein
MNKFAVDSLCNSVREVSFALHQYLRHGHLEKVYENGLSHRLRRNGLNVIQQAPLPVHDEDGTLLGDYYADLLVEGELIVELKAVSAIANEHVAQVLGYLRSSRKRYGLLINFGSPKLFVKRYVLDPTPTGEGTIATKRHQNPQKGGE